MEKPWATFGRRMGAAIVSQATWKSSMGERGGTGPARCWIMETCTARADELCRLLTVGANGAHVGIVALDFIEADGGARLDDAYFVPRAARQMYDEIIARALTLPKGVLRVLAVDQARLAGFGLSNVIRALMLEEPRHFDAIVLAHSGEGAPIERMEILCQRFEVKLGDSAG